VDSIWFFSIMDVGDEQLQVLSIKMLGLLLNSNPKYPLNFARINGFETLSSLFSNVTPTESLCDSILGFAMGIGSRNEKKGLYWIFYSTVVEKNNSIIVYPEAVHVLLEILKMSENVQLQIKYLTELEKLFEQQKENMEIFWSDSTTNNCFDWFFEFLLSNQKITENKTEKIKSEDENPTPNDEDTEEYSIPFLVVYSIIQKMIMYDFGKKYPQIFSKLQLMDSEHFYVEVIKSVLLHFEKNPTLSEDQSSQDIITNLTAFYKFF